MEKGAEPVFCGGAGYDSVSLGSFCRGESGGIVGAGVGCIIVLFSIV